MSFEIPIAVFIYKRPEKTRKLFEILKKLGPTKLYIFANGPAAENETEICLETQSVFKNIDWPCEIYRDFKQTNIGLGKRIVSGLNHLFQVEEKAIILEDDCFPEPYFFKFCEELLNKYSGDEQVLHINGFNPAEELFLNCKDEYFATHFPIPCWGWATWRRAWKKFTNDPEKWQKEKKLLFTRFQQKNFDFWTATFERMRNSEDFWDLQWNLDIWKNNGIVLTSTRSLIENAGNDEAASYMKNEAKKNNNLNPDFGQSKIQHPKNLLIFDKEYEFEDAICHFITSCFNPKKS